MEYAISLNNPDFSQKKVDPPVVTSDRNSMQGRLRFIGATKERPGLPFTKFDFSQKRENPPFFSSHRNNMLGKPRFIGLSKREPICPSLILARLDARDRFGLSLH